MPIWPYASDDLFVPFSGDCFQNARIPSRMHMTQRLLEPQDDSTGTDWPASPWLRALLGMALAVLLLAAHALPHLLAPVSR
jgi:hypothetical protein